MSWDGCVLSLSFVPTVVLKEPPEWTIRVVTFPLAFSSFHCLTPRPRRRSLTHVFSSRILLAWIRVARACPRMKRGSIPNHRYAFLSKGACRSCSGSRNTRQSLGVPIGLIANASFRPVGTVTTHEHASSYGACISGLRQLCHRSPDGLSISPNCFSVECVETWGSVPALANRRLRTPFYDSGRSSRSR